MTPEAILIEILQRVGALQNKVVLIATDELTRWPEEAVTALRAQKIIKKARPASHALCPGCEQECLMPVQTIPAATGDSSLFIVCDKRGDVNRVEITSTQLTQWQTSANRIATFIADCLSLRYSGKRQGNANLLEVGMVKGDKRTQMLCLRCEGELLLVGGSVSVRLAEAVQFNAERYSIDQELVRRLVDSSTVADSHYTPSTARLEVRKLDTQARHEACRKKARELRRKHRDKSERWIAKRIEKLGTGGNIKWETIRTIIRI